MKGGNKIVMIANAGHRASDSRIFQKEARSLAAAGFDVTLLVPHDKDEDRDGVKILSVARYPKGWKKLITSPWLLYKRALTLDKNAIVGSSRVDLQACKLEYSIVSPK